MSVSNRGPSPLIVPSAVSVRDARASDMEAVQAVYAHYVLRSLASFEEVPPSVAEMGARRDAVLADGLPYLVAQERGVVVGYCYATAFRARSAYRYTIEDSVYVAQGKGGRGIGSALLAELLKRCDVSPWRQMLAVIGHSGNAGSIALHRRFGFRDAGIQLSVGFKLGQWVDTVIMQRPLGEGDSSSPP